MSVLSGKQTSHRVSSEGDDMPFNFSSGGQRRSTQKKMYSREEAPEILINDVEERQSMYKNKEAASTLDRMP